MVTCFRFGPSSSFCTFSSPQIASSTFTSSPQVEPRAAMISNAASNVCNAVLIFPRIYFPCVRARVHIISNAHAGRLATAIAS